MKKLMLGLVASIWLGCANAAIWTDMWWNPNESGWGLNVAQQSDVLFLTWYVYRPDGTPTWYSAAAFRGAPPAGYVYPGYYGDIYESHGPWYGGAFNPNNVTRRKVGVVGFAPTAPYRANVIYTIDGVQVSKTVERLTWTHIPLSGTYIGGYKTTVPTCPLPAPVDPWGFIILDVKATVAADGISGGMTTDVYMDGSYQCTLLGNYRQYGSIYQVSNTAVCGTRIGRINFNDLSRSDEGIEGDMVVLASNGCSVDFKFSAVKGN